MKKNYPLYLCAIIIALLIFALITIAQDRNEWKGVALTQKAERNQLFTTNTNLKKANDALRVYKHHYDAVSSQIAMSKLTAPKVNEVLIDAIYRVAEHYGLPPDSLIAISKGQIIYSTMWFAQNSAPFEY